MQGNSVFEARSLYALLNPNEIIEDEEACAGAFKKEQEIQAISVVEYPVRLMPNPAHDFTTLYYQFADNDNIQLTVTNELGELMHTADLPFDSYTYNIFTSQYATGVYNYQLLVNGQKVKRDKFIVVK